MDLRPIIKEVGRGAHGARARLLCGSGALHALPQHVHAPRLSVGNLNLTLHGASARRAPGCPPHSRAMLAHGGGARRRVNKAPYVSS